MTPARRRGLQIDDPLGTGQPTASEASVEPAWRGDRSPHGGGAAGGTGERSAGRDQPPEQIAELVDRADDARIHGRRRARRRLTERTEG